jgi:predicted ATPase
VTFRFTDVEGSTRLLDELGPDRYAAELAGHRQIVRDALAGAGGGGGRHARGCLLLCLLARGRRGRGGRGATDAGNGRRSERIWQLGDDEHPPPRSARRSNLPIPTSPFVGRGRELRELVELVREARLVTLTGTGGSGKTRLAVEVARSLHDELRDGVLFVPLARIDTPELVLPAIVEAAGVRMVDDLPRLATLVVLDNFEQLLEPASEIGALLAESPDLTILATSVAPLRIAAEREYPLEPLERDDALELLRVRAAAAGTRLEPDSVADAICARLDDLPLALELGAARLHSLDPATLLERLDRRLALLTRGARDAPERQRTLRTAISWSVDLLDEDGRALFARLGVFSGSFSLEAVQAVCGASLDDVDALAAARRELGTAALDRQSDDLAEAVDAVLAALQIE